MKEDMIVYWDGKGNPLIRIIPEDKELLVEIDKQLYPIIENIFGKDLDNSSFEYSEEWGG